MLIKNYAHALIRKEMPAIPELGLHGLHGAGRPRTGPSQAGGDLCRPTSPGHLYHYKQGEILYVHNEPAYLQYNVYALEKTCFVKRLNFYTNVNLNFNFKF